MITGPLCRVKSARPGTGLSPMVSSKTWFAVGSFCALKQKASSNSPHGKALREGVAAEHFSPSWSIRALCKPTWPALLASICARSDALLSRSSMIPCWLNFTIWGTPDRLASISNTWPLPKTDPSPALPGLRLQGISVAGTVSSAGMPGCGKRICICWSTTPASWCCPGSRSPIWLPTCWHELRQPLRATGPLSMPTPSTGSKPSWIQAFLRGPAIGPPIGSTSVQPPAAARMIRLTRPTALSKPSGAIPSAGASRRGCVVDRRQAETLYDSGKEPTVSRLLEMDQQIQVLQDALIAVNKNSTNSSKPPSADGPEVPRKQSPSTGRKPGAQTGHEGTHRELLPLEQMDHVYERYPEQCEKCSLPLDPASAKETSAPIRHQIFEIPEIKPIKIEFRYHEVECACGHRTRASLPAKEVQSCFGPRVHAAIAYLSASHLGTRRGVSEIMSTLFGIEICKGVPKCPTWLIHRLTYRRTNHDNIHVRDYKEEGTITTPFDMTVLNDLDRFHLVMDTIDLKTA